MRDTLRGKTALVTGGATRIGRELCLALAENGANVVIHQRRGDDQGSELAAALTGRGVDAWRVEADFEKPDEYESLIARAAAQAGRLDMLINSAAIFPAGALEDVTLPDVHRAMQVNAWVPFVLSRDFARLAGKGKIINLLDTRISGYDWTHAAYILSKHALALLTRMSALRFAPAVAVNAIAPGLILPPAGKGGDYLDALAGTVPLQRHGAPRDVAQAAMYLLRSEFVTGQVIYVDGGMHLAEGSHGPHPHQ
ncbi:MAG: SDR family oxidoreductase [Betaproteobacteria bacterium]|nr:SDR family oxidoreductase [Betaproteobacteria bacterium]